MTEIYNAGNPYDVIRTSDGQYQASDGELVITDADTLQLPEPADGEYVLVKRADVDYVDISTPVGNVGQIEEEARFDGDDAVMFVSDGNDWYIRSDTLQLSRLIPDSVVNQWPHDEGEESTLNDAEGDVSMTISGASWQSDGDAVGGYVLEYDGVDDITESDADNPFTYMYNGDFTWTAFVRPDSFSSDQNTIIHHGDEDVGIALEFDGGDLAFHSNDEFRNTSSSLSLSSGEWHFVSVRWDDGDEEATLGVDGNYENVGGGLISEPDAPLRFGWDDNLTSSGSSPLDGGMDEVTSSDSFLSDEELDELQSRRSDI